MKRFFSGLLLLCAAIHACAADPLFESDDLLEVRLQGPFDRMDRERDKTKTYGPATLTYEISGESLILPIELEVRGNRRLSGNTCDFPPVRVIFKKKDVKDTLFEKQRKLKLVTQCSPNRQRYEQYLITEYLIYRTLNLLTDNSYRVRLLSVDYVDEDGQLMHGGYGFFIEARKRLAKRIDRKRINVVNTNATKLNGEHLSLVSLFQFMIGNTDWSATHGGTEECCHNGKLFGEEEGSDNLFIPYDFDMTGLVNPEYAAVAPALKLDSIRERRYRGYCRNLTYLDQHISTFNSKRDEITALFENSAQLTKRVRLKNLSYIDRFYAVINNPRRVERFIRGWCHPSEFVESASEPES